MKYDRIEGIDKDISKLVMGCDNQDDINEASKLWDHWIEVGEICLIQHSYMAVVIMKKF